MTSHMNLSTEQDLLDECILYKQIAPDNDQMLLQQYLNRLTRIEQT